jgi:hypothetical protein
LLVSQSSAMCNPSHIRIITLQPFSLTKNKRKQHRTVRFNKDMTVSFNKDMTVNEIEHHCELTSKERMSIWYTDDDYRSFNLQETQEQLSGPLAAKIDKIERSKHVIDVQYLVLRAQMVQRKIAKNDTNETKQDYSKWLADFYQHHSESCAIAARQRGLENDLCLLNIKLRDASSMLLKNSFLFNGLSVSNDNNSINNSVGAAANNERWSVGEGCTNNNKRVASPKSSRNLRRMLCKDLDLSCKTIDVTVNPIFSPTSGLTSLESIVSPIGCFSKKKISKKKVSKKKVSCVQQQERWCPISRKADSNKKDLPLKPIRHSLTPPYLCP